MEDKQLDNPQESMQIILSMIENSKTDIRRHNFLFLMWGFLMITASLIQYVCVKLQMAHGHYAWLLMLIGAVITIVDVNKKKNQRKAKTFVGKSMQVIWIPLGIGMCILVTLGTQAGFLASFPIFMLLYGVGTFATGRILNFQPLMYGSMVAFGCAFISIFIDGAELLLLLAISLLFSYVIPGYILKNQPDASIR